MPTVPKPQLGDDVVHVVGPGASLESFASAGDEAGFVTGRPATDGCRASPSRLAYVAVRSISSDQPSRPKDRLALTGP
jgi:hypothetical protein